MGWRGGMGWDCVTEVDWGVERYWGGSAGTKWRGVGWVSNRVYHVHLPTGTSLLKSPHTPGASSNPNSRQPAMVTAR